MASPTPFNPEALSSHARDEIRPAIGIGAVVWRYTVLVPLEETAVGAAPRRVATAEDIDNLERTLFAHFGGATVLPVSMGYGLRAGVLELNKHHPVVVYAAAVAASERYFEALRRELERALDQEAILVERQEVWLH